VPDQHIDVEPDAIRDGATGNPILTKEQADRIREEWTAQHPPIPGLRWVISFNLYGEVSSRHLEVIPGWEDAFAPSTATKATSARQHDVRTKASEANRLGALAYQGWFAALPEAVRKASTTGWDDLAEEFREPMRQAAVLVWQHGENAGFHEALLRTCRPVDSAPPAPWKTWRTSSPRWPSCTRASSRSRKSSPRSALASPNSVETPPQARSAPRSAPGEGPRLGDRDRRRPPVPGRHRRLSRKVTTPMPDVNLSIDLDALFVEPTELDGDPVNVRTAMRDAVVQAAATKLIAGFDYEELHEMRQEVQRVRSDLVRERLLAEVEAAFSEPVQRTTSWGEKLGEPSSLRELIRAELEAFLNNTNRRRRDTYDKPQSLAELIEIISRDVMSTTLRKSVSEVRAKVDAEVQKILVGAIAEKLAGVK
jgi:hypothetical protein